MARLWRVALAASLAISSALATAGAGHAAAAAAHERIPGGTVATLVKRGSVLEAARAHPAAPAVSQSNGLRVLDPKALEAARANPKPSQAVVRDATPARAGIFAHSAPQGPNPIPLESHDAARSQFGQNIEPPDTQVAAGPTQLVEMVNNVVRVTDKSGVQLAAADLNGFFPAAPAGFFYTDPRVLYDAESGRWFATALQFQTSPSFNSNLFIGVSTTSDALQPFDFTFVLQSTTILCDQPKLGVNTDKVTISCASFNANGFVHEDTLIGNKSELLAGLANPHFWLIIDGNLFNAVPAISLSPTTTAFMVENGSLFNAGANVCHTVAFTAFTGAPSTATPNPTPANRTDTCLPFTQTSAPPQAVQPNGAHTIDSGDDRFLSAAWQNGVLWTGGADACTPNGDTMVRSCLRLVEVSTAGPPSVSSSFDLAGTQMYEFNPAVTMQTNGDLFVAFASSSSSFFPNLGIAEVPLAGQASGTPDLVQTSTLSTTTYADAAGFFRWGDYSAAAPDPAVPGAVWLSGEYVAGSGDRAWGTAAWRVDEPPLATSINPNSGPSSGGQSVTITGSFFQPGATVRFSSVGSLATSVVVAPDGSSISARTPSGGFDVGPSSVTVTNPDFQQVTLPGSYTYSGPGPVGNSFFFAEGNTIPGFNETLYLLIPNGPRVSGQGMAQVTYFTEAGPVGPIAHAMTPGEVTPVNVLADVGANHTGVSARVDFNAPGIAERQLNFAIGQWHGSTDKVGVTGPNAEWDFAEGSTLSIFTEFLTLQNPDPTTASNVTINYFLDTGVKVVKTITLPKGSRTTVRVPDGDQTNTSCTIDANGNGVNCGVGPNFNGVSAQVVVNSGPAIIAERPFYVNGFSFGSGAIRDGHVAFGANSPAATWSFAEGTTLGGFNEFLTLQDPGTMASNVTITYFTNAGQTVVRTLTLPPTSRTTLNVNLGNTSPGPTACTVSGGQASNCGVGAGVVGVSASVTVTGGPNIVVERPMYLFRDFGSGPVPGATDVVGANSFGTLFGFSSAQTTAGENDYLTIQNPSSGQATVTIAYYDSAPGFPRTATVVVPANTRQTVQVFGSPSQGGAGPGLTNLGIVVSSDTSVLVEKPTYNSTPARLGATDTLGFTPNPAF